MKDTIKSIYMWPVWSLQVFGMSKSFSGNPVLGSPVLNKLGLHAARAFAAHSIANFRWFLLSWQVPREYRSTFRAQGYLVLPDFLSDEEFSALNQQVRSQKGCEVRECIQGDTLTHRILLDDEARSKLPAVNSLLEHPLFERLLTYCGANRKRPLHYVQAIKNGARQAERSDPQKVLHSDTFHPTMKSWYFLDDVESDRGPFTYVPGSHRLTRKRLAWEYRRSLTARNSPDGYSERGSLRVDDEELQELGLPSPISITVAKNTLVIANTCGFHCRGNARAGMNRLEIWSYSRTNPFNPFPGIGSKLASKVEYKAAKALWRWLDKRASAKGLLSSWHPVSAEGMGDSIKITPEGG